VSAIVRIVLLILPTAFLAFAWMAVAASNGWRYWANRVALCVMTMGALIAVVGMLLGWFLSLGEGAEQIRRWVVIVALGVELAPFILSLMINRNDDFETDQRA
jgi:hypothetical protein